MAKYILKRIGLAVVTAWLVATLTFFLMNLVPGGPFMAEKALTPQAQAAMEQKYGLDKPLLVQYGAYLLQLLQGNLGTSFRNRTPVSEMLMQKLPWTLLLCLASGCLMAAYTWAYEADRY